MKCDCCRKERADISVAASSCGAVSFAYCTGCLTQGREPYYALVASLYGCESLKDVADWFKPVIEATLAAENKTVDDFFKDVTEATKKYNDEYGL